MRNGLLVTIAVVLAPVLPAAGKMYEEPRSFKLQDKSQEQLDRKVLPKIDAERLQAEDRVNTKNSRQPGPVRFAVAADVNYAATDSGTWQTLPDGRLWRLRIQTPGAKSMNLGITRFEVAAGVKLWVYDPKQQHVEGPYTARHRSQQGSLWTPIIEGEEIIVEVFVPTGAPEPVIVVGKVNQGYRGLKMGLAGTEGTCNIDEICPQGVPWANQIRALGVYTISGSLVCTGNLVNNTAHDFRPYVLSANHCTVSAANAASIVFYWNFQSATCGTHGPGSLAENQTGATYHASYAPSDFVLFELNTTPDPTYNVFWSGWDATGTTPPSTVGIHHPRGDVKAISLSNTAPETTAYYSDVVDPAGNHWRAVWDAGVTEGGSSGSCLFNTSNHRCIGQLHGGPSGCGETPANMHDFYGRLSMSWTGGGTSATRLKDWLDPGSTGALGMDGDPHITTANGVNYDFQGAGEFVALRDADGLEIQTRQAPIATNSFVPTDGHDGLATCVSLNTAVAARVGKRRVTYQPDLSGVPDPSGLQLRIDGALTTLGAAGIDLGAGGRLVKTKDTGGLEIDFNDGSTLFVTPGWWPSQSKWYLNVDLSRAPAADGMSGTSSQARFGTLGTGGIMGAIAPGSWLPALPDGSSMGPMPGPVHERYLDLYKKFAEAWRVNDKTSLFDYAPGTSTANYTMRAWPLENPPCVLPETKPVEPASRAVAERACRPITAKNAHANCVFDVMVTGNTGFARTYQLSQRVVSGSTRITVSDDKNPTEVEHTVTFTATVRRAAVNGDGVPAGAAQLAIDGRKAGRPVRLDARGQARWKTSALKPGKHAVVAEYLPAQGSVFLGSRSPAREHVVSGEDE